jgi:hypothetical protein
VRAVLIGVILYAFGALKLQNSSLFTALSVRKQNPMTEISRWSCFVIILQNAQQYL